MRLEIPFNVKLNPESKWVKMADLFPWEEIEREYAKHFEGRNEGQVAKSSRLAFGAVYIYTSEGLTDEKVREHIQENPHMQYFCGFAEYMPEPPFDASLMVHFRKRIPPQMIIEITEKVFAGDAVAQMDALPPESEDEATSSEEDHDEESKLKNSKKRGTLLLDATCCPQDIRYPTEIGLLNQARELCEEIIDRLYSGVIDQCSHRVRREGGDWFGGGLRLHHGHIMEQCIRRQLTSAGCRGLQAVIRLLPRKHHRRWHISQPRKPEMVQGSRNKVIRSRSWP
jgi:hypothetical protein